MTRRSVINERTWCPKEMRESEGNENKRMIPLFFEMHPEGSILQEIQGAHRGCAIEK